MPPQRPFGLFSGGVGALEISNQHALRVPEPHTTRLYQLNILRLVFLIFASVPLALPQVALARNRDSNPPATSKEQPQTAASFATDTIEHTSTAGKADTITIKANGNPAPTITVDDTTPLPKGVTFNSPKLSISAKTLVGPYKIKFTATNTTNDVKHTASQTLVLTVKAAGGLNSGESKPPCENNTYTVRLGVLQGADADGLAAALNGAFSKFTVLAAAASSPTQSGDQSSGDSSADGQGKKSSPPKQFLCVYMRGTANPKNGQLNALASDAVTQHERSDLDLLVQQFDRSEFAGIGLDGRFLVALAHIDPSDLVAALPAPVPGFELSSDDVVDRHYLVLHPASSELPLETKAGPDLATQAAKVKHDLLALDAQIGMIATQAAQRNDVQHAVMNLTPASSRSDFASAEVSLERWDATHTVQLQALNPRDVAVYLNDQLPPPGYSLQVLAQQRAITIRPSGLDVTSLGLGPQKGIMFASDAIEREALYEQTEAEKAWEQKLQADGAAGAKQSSGSPSQPSVTQTNSTTTITTPQSSSSSASLTAKTTPAIQVQTTTSTQTTSGTNSNAQGSSSTGSGSGGQGSGGSSGQASNSSTSGASGSGSGGGTGTAAGTGGSPGGGSASGKGSSQSQTQQPPEPFKTGKVVRLYHLRQASNIATVLNAMAPAGSSTSLVEALSDFGNDDLLLILPPAPGQSDNTKTLQRTIAYLDEPRPTISLQVWSYEISSEKEANADDRRRQVRHASDVADAYSRFSLAVQHADYNLRRAMTSGMGAALNYPASADAIARGPFLDDVFYSYLTKRFDQCVRDDRYCLGYENALRFPTTHDDLTQVTLGRFVLWLAAARDNQAEPLINAAIRAMDRWDCQYRNSGAAQLCFDNFHAALTFLAQRRNLHLFRASILDFLFLYKMSVEYPNNFDPYYLQRSAQNLDNYLSDLVNALNRDLDQYLHAELEQEATDITHHFRRHVGVANYGEVQVAGISGDSASVSGTVNNYFDITQPALLKDVIGGLLSGAGASGGSGGSGGGGQIGSTGGSGDSTGGAKGTGSGSSGSSATGGGSGSSAAAGALASAAKLLTPWQAVALNALAVASAPPQLMAQINAQTTLSVTPTSLDTASAAELSLSLQISNPTTTVDASKGTPSSFIRQDLANSVANYNVQTKVRVDSMKLFQVSSLSMDLTHPQSPVPLPIVGWAWDAVFGSVPVMKDFFAWPRGPATIQNRSIAVVRAVVVPTAMDLGLSIPYRDDRVFDPVTGTAKSLSTTDETSNKFREFHQKLMRCVLGDDETCLISVRLSDTPEQIY